ncbi:DGQHR domain-containing protein [Serratia ureilytica]|uniref:DGQHR domain-containing protein n=1 Tax=Serratia ureilytica TaxID=300181 RepID=UPI0018A788D4|nr:DGQHR domain-containing protein [Serratia ureilytica]MBF4187967.1 DGQHR domain-containing protein [Serratia ureilytica]MBF8442079.1 DGQHR domain-containing protein [Serratia ureilytica]MBF8446224.1 DGQHR domain-containing protein [Serratia ureilytica]
MIINEIIKISQKHREFILTTMSAKILSEITYTAVRGVDDEVGAVQRILIERRIKGIKEFVLSGGDFPAAIVLNWTSKDNMEIGNDSIEFEVKNRSAQIIDGQHRVAGIKAAIKEDPTLESLQIPVVIYFDLSTKECADIFLAINTEQKPAPRSLVYDLYGISSDTTLDPASSRARDIAEYLNKEESSPYFGKIKFPGEKRRKGGIALSTAVSAIKPLVEERAIFEQVGITELSLQFKCFYNYFSAIASNYAEAWDSNYNAFQYAAGFSAACEFYVTKIIPYCTQKKSFEQGTIEEVLNIKRNGLIKQDEVSKISGKEAIRLIIDRLDKSFEPKVEQKELRF